MAPYKNLLFLCPKAKPNAAFRADSSGQKKIKTSLILITLLMVLFPEPAPTAPSPPSATSPTETTAQEKNDNKPADSLENEPVKNYEKDQISCAKKDCIRISFDPPKIDEQISDLMEKRAGKILIDFKEYVIKFDDKKMEVIRDYVREIAKRDGRVIIEPLYTGIRSITTPLPFLKDIFSVSYNVFTRIRNLIKYRDTAHYQAKILYHPVKHYITSVYFMHRNYGDICIVLKSNCNTIEYINDETFDLILSRRLKVAIKNRKPLRILFNKTPAYLPAGELNLQALKKMNTSLRIYKWMIATGKVKKRNIIKKRFITTQAIASLISVSIQAYDLVQSLLTYLPAQKMTAEVLFSGTEKGGRIRLLLFSPEQKSNESNCFSW